MKNMRKKIFALVLLIVLTFNCTLTFAATSSGTITEDKTAKIVVNGAIFKNTNVLLLKNGTPMLSTDYFTALGITAKNQVWDKSKKKLTLSKGTVKLTLELDSSNYTLNGKKSTINIKPFTYKGKPYFPAELVATSFGNKFVPDAETNTYFIRSNEDFTKNKKLLDKILIAMNGISKVKVTENATLTLKSKWVQLNLVAPAVTLSDKQAKIYTSDINYKMTTNGELSENNIQMCFFDNQLNMKVDDGEWAAQQLSDEEAAQQFEFKNIFGDDDLICSALTTISGKNSNELILKGNIIMGTSVPLFMSSQGLNDNKISQKSIEITLNKVTNIVSKIVLKQSGTTVIDKDTYTFSLDYVISYSDINGTFEVEIPAELKK